jgi:hypothetical protein
MVYIANLWSVFCRFVALIATDSTQVASTAYEAVKS